VLAAATAAALTASVLGWSTRGEPAPGPRTTTARAPAAPLPHHKLTIRPPQFVVASFDGSGDASLLRYWRDVGKRAHARFTFFLSGVYLIGEERRALYLPPQHDPGVSAIGYTQASDGQSSRQVVRGILEQLAAAHGDGHEIGTHFNGHFCSPFAGSVDKWSANDWRQEISQFDELLSRASQLNGLRRVELGFGPEDVVGARTPCLQGNLDVLDRVLREHGFRYESSSSAPLGTWPSRHHGIWRFPLPEIPLAGARFNVIAMDYNFLANQTPAASNADARRIEDQTYTSLVKAFGVSYRGNRAPFAVANHFAHWNRNAYERALTRFLGHVCRLREVRCVPYTEVVDWLDHHRELLK
jgi:peptidoglycan/xylan/chitin deacetylase (PgdA/CDA1 family)